MNRHDFTLRKNIRTLKRLKTQILVLSGELEGCIVRHTNSCCPKEFLNDDKIEWHQVQARQNTVHRDVYLRLALAGDDGLTSGEILRLLEAKKTVSRDVVRQALNRMRKAGTARRVGRLWYLI